MLEHPIEGIEGVAHPGQLFGVGIGKRIRHLLEVGASYLFAKAFHQLFEVLARLRGNESVLLEPAHRAGQIRRQQIKCHAPFGGDFVGDLLPALVARLAGIRLELVDSGPFLGQHLFELGRYLAVRAAQIPTIELILPLEPKLIQQVAQALNFLAFGSPPAPIEHPLHGFVEITVGQQIVGQLGQHRVGIVDLGVLGSVPAPIIEAPGHPRPRYVARAPAASLLRRLVRCRPSRRNSTALATTPGSSDPPARASTGPDNTGIRVRVSA